MFAFIFCVLVLALTFLHIQGWEGREVFFLPVVEVATHIPEPAWEGLRITPLMGAILLAQVAKAHEVRKLSKEGRAMYEAGWPIEACY